MNGEVRSSKPGDLRLVSRGLRRRDAEEKIAGTTRYAADVPAEGQLVARLVRSPLPSAAITRRDVAAALAIPGVVAVLLGEDVPLNVVRVDVPGQETAVATLQATMQVLAVDRVRYHGEPVALVLADDEDVLAAAVAAVEVDYEPLPGVYDPDRALADGAPAVHEAGNLLARWDIDHGDFDRAAAEADVVVEGEYRTQFVDHAYLEPEAGHARLDDEGVITITVATQVVEHFRDVANILGLPHSRVRVIAPYVGGGFGGKEDMTVEPYLGLAVHHTGRPVRMQWTRQESLVARAKRHPMRMRYRTAARADGTILGHDIDITADAGAYAFLSALVLLYAATCAGGPYRLDHLRLRSRVAYTNNPPCSAFRGFGSMQVVFGYESQVDRVARALGLDPAEVRKRNALAKGDVLPVGQPLGTEVLLADTIDAVRDEAGPLPEPAAGHLRVGRGIASNIQPYGRLVWLHDTATAWVGFEHDGSVVVRIGVQDIGGGQASSLAQIAAEILGVPMELVAVHFGDSALTPRAGTTTATRMLYMSGNAVHDAAVRLRAAVVAVAAAERGVPARSMRLEAGAVRDAEGEMPLREVLDLAQRQGVPLHVYHTFHGPTGTPATRQLANERIFPDFTFGTHLADVEVDTRTGAVRLLGYVACHDVGRAINPVSVRGQIAGGAVQGIGSALGEEVVLDDGVNTSGTLFQYLMPTSADVPAVRALFLESGEGVGPFGARGIGEPPIGPCAAAIANAIEDAVGVRVTTLPMRPDRVWAAMQHR